VVVIECGRRGDNLAMSKQGYARGKPVSENVSSNTRCVYYAYGENKPGPAGRITRVETGPSPHEEFPKPVYGPNIDYELCACVATVLVAGLITITIV
jgi:hypothetical protein